MYLKIPDLIEDYRKSLGESSTLLLDRAESEMTDIDAQLEDMRNKGFARHRNYKELKRKRYEKRNEVLGLRRKEAEESQRKAKFDEIEDIAGLMDVSESEAEKLVENRQIQQLRSLGGRGI